MKKKICLLLTLVVSIFMFSGRVEAIAMYMKCNYSNNCPHGAMDWSTGINQYVPLTLETGNVMYYAVGADYRNLGVTSTYMAYPFEDNYNNGSDMPGCWLKSWYKGNATCNGNIAYSNRSPQNILLNEMCPACLYMQPWTSLSDVEDNYWNILLGENNIFSATTYDRLIDGEVVPGGESSIDKIERIEETEYVVYTFRDGDGNKKIIMEGYVGDGSYKDGAYAYVGPSIWTFAGDDIMNHQLNMIQDLGSDYWKVHSVDKARMIFARTDINGSSWFTKVNVCKGLSVQQCKDTYAYEVLFDSNGNDKNLKDLAAKWYDDNSSLINEETGIMSLVANDKLNDTCESINTKLSEGKIFQFEDYSSENLISGLENAVKSLAKAYDNAFNFKDYTNENVYTELDDSILTKAYKDIFENDTLLGIAYGYSEEFHINHEKLIAALKEDLEDILLSYIYGDGSDIPEINVVNIDEYLNDYTLMYFTTVSYLNANEIMFGLTTEQIRRVDDLKREFEKLVKKEELDIYPVVDCEGILGEELIKKINSYLDIIKIIVPIILIGFGVIEFTKAIFGGDDDMKKAQQSFFKRIGIAVIIFLTPTIVNFILSLANKVWPIIQPSTCRMFE